MRIRVGIDVGGTFTKAVAIDIQTGNILGLATIPTTHRSRQGVSEGIVNTLTKVVQESGINVQDIELISHSTTQAINALLESDTYKVGIVAMGVGPTKRDVIKRTKLDDPSINTHQDLDVCHEFLDTSHLITEQEVGDTINRLKGDGAEVIVATEAFGVDDPSNETFVMEHAAKHGLPSTSSHELSGVYGLEIRTLTATVNASVLPKTVQVANYVEEAIRGVGVSAPLLIMRGDGGVTDMNTFKTKPILTVLSGPAASVAGALLYLKISNGIFVEVGGTSTNICIIKNGKPEIRYVTINDHPTCIRSMDVRILGVAGGSMISIHQNRISSVGPRSAHIAGLEYSCFADPAKLEQGEIVMVRPKPNDSEYVAIRCGDDTYAITNTCAANALEMIEPNDYSYANITSAKVALRKLGEYVGTSYTEAAMSIIQTSSFEITKAISKILKEYKMDMHTTKVIGGGGGASVLVPFATKQLQMKYEKAKHAEVISSIGAASALLQEQLEISMINPTPEKIATAHKKIHEMLVEKGAIPESVSIDSEYMAEKSVLRVSAMGNVEMDSVGTSKSVFTLDESRHQVSDIMQLNPNLIDLCFESDHYLVFMGHVMLKRLFGKRERHHIAILDRFGKMKLGIKNGKIFQGGAISIVEELGEFLKSRHSDVAPRVYLVNDLKMMDFSSLVLPKHILNAVGAELDENQKAAVIVEL